MLLLFDSKHQYLGEVALTPDGALQSIILTAKGDQAIGVAAAVWQTKGIRVEQRVPNDGAELDSFYVERVQPRHPGFKKAFLAWCDNEKIAVVDINGELVNFWEGLLRLPLTSSERFTYILGICRTPKEKLKEWEELILKLSLSDESTVQKRDLNKLKVKLGKEMTNAFCEVKD